MKISTKTLIILFSAIILVCIAFIIIGSSIDYEERIAKIYKNGELLYKIELNSVTTPYTIDLDGNVILVKPGQISMQSADCPDKLCVHMGAISNGLRPIVCLPNRVTITVVGESGGEFDAVAGR